MAAILSCCTHTLHCERACSVAVAMVLILWVFLAQIMSLRTWDGGQKKKVVTRLASVFFLPRATAKFDQGMLG